jgi:hypothetical protein
VLPCLWLRGIFVVASREPNERIVWVQQETGGHQLAEMGLNEAFYNEPGCVGSEDTNWFVPPLLRITLQLNSAKRKSFYCPKGWKRREKRLLCIQKPKKKRLLLHSHGIMQKEKHLICQSAKHTPDRRSLLSFPKRCRGRRAALAGRNATTERALGVIGRISS